MATEHESAELEERKRQLLLFKQDYEDLKKLISDLPNQSSRPVMVPYGNVAFLDGKFDNPNELFVSLGAEYFAQYDCKSAVSVIDRRKQMIDDLIQEVDDEQEILEITKKLEIYANIEHDVEEEEAALDAEESEQTAVDIREEWTEEDEVLAIQKKGRLAYEKSLNIAKPETAQVQAPPEKKQPAVPLAHVAVKERIVERKTSRPKDPMLTATVKQARESLFKQALRRSEKEEEDADSAETFAPIS